MVKNSIKIYARLKQEDPAKTAAYEIMKAGKNEDITFRLRNLTEFVNNKPLYHRFRFQKVFNQESNQAEIFDTIAKPVVDSVLRGFNGTVFAYGQTGSGKTYAITGASDDYNERGIIPRSIEEIFDAISKASDKYTICISYLEIYNEVGYDLLNPSQKISSLEELPKVALLEDAKGESHLRNLSVQQVSSEQEAMKLLFLGDTNRTIAETPMNVYSSRSHCIFTICVTARNKMSGKIRRSKLNLVDLAGSERVNKSKISGTTLTEAKHINLSLHYLEQVVLALSQPKRGHIPYRNSMLTYMLKDSLAGNCITVLLATLAVNKRNLEESIATCKFAQRVADVNMEAVVNEEVDPQQEIEYLRREIEDLRKQLLKHTQFKANGSGKLSSEETENCKKLVENYLNDSKDDLRILNSDMRHIQFCFKLLKQTAKDHEKQTLKLKSTENANNELVEKYKKIIKEKEEEISILTALLHSDSNLKSPNPPLNFDAIKPTTTDINDTSFSALPFTLTTDQKEAFTMFIQDPQNSVEVSCYKQSINRLHEIAKDLTATVEQCQRNILALKSKLHLTVSRVVKAEINVDLHNEQAVYQESLVKLQKLKDETQDLKLRLEEGKIKVIEKFKQWYDKISHRDIVVPKVEPPKHIWNTEAFSHSSPKNLKNVNTAIRANGCNYTKFPFEAYGNSRCENYNECQFENFLKKGCDNSCCTSTRNNCGPERIGDNIDNFGHSSKLNQQSDNYLKHSNLSPSHRTPESGTFQNRTFNETTQALYEDIMGYNDSFGENAQQLVSERPYSSELPKRPVDRSNGYYPKSPMFMQSKSQESVLSSKNFQVKHGKNYPPNVFYDALQDTQITNGYKNDFARERRSRSPHRHVSPKQRSLSSESNQENIYNGENGRLDQQSNGNVWDFRTWNLPATNNNYMRACNNFHFDNLLQPNSLDLNNDYRRNFAKDNRNQLLNNSNLLHDVAPTTIEDSCSYNTFWPQDSKEFRDFIRKIPLTGDPDVDDEIVSFYRTKFNYPQK